ncbi:MAG TPA: YciI family protein [Chthoniobacter sp.]|nr:YciI family protein [Chthoniobacter sp.]
MNSDSEKSDYLLLFRGADWHKDLSPDEIQKTMTTWMAWFSRLMAEGRCKGGQSLAPDSKVVSGKMKNVVDGPYAEAKESVAGYFILSVSSLEEATEIAQECPTLGYGTTVEVRPLLARCAASELAAREMATAEV